MTRGYAATGVSPDQLRAALRDEPFRPFVLRLADGRRVPVSNPVRVAYGGGQTVAMFASEGEEVVVVDLHDAELEGPA
jgi:hypothetical protein